MRALVIARQKMPPPVEMLPALVQGFHAWRDKYRDKLESFSFFVSSTGGFAILNAEDENEAYQILLEWPLTPFSEIEVLPFVDGDHALSRWSAQMEGMAAGGS